ncbi:MAG: hypothetical protein AAGH90_10440 [Pseudomonadota bacterium]
MDAWIAALGVILAYAGCVLLFQSGERRLAHPAVKVTKAQMRMTKPVGWIMILSSVIALCVPSGIERGLAYWLAAVAAAGCLSLLVSALMPKVHLLSVAIISGLCLLVAALFVALGGAA